LTGPATVDNARIRSFPKTTKREKNARWLGRRKPADRFFLSNVVAQRGLGGNIREIQIESFQFSVVNPR
jgi:hypothetical protein